ncbi:lanthionine synthetase LanC family protein, partial [Streptomyces beihaiensis]
PRRAPAGAAGDAAACDPERLLKLALDIGDDLLARACRDEHRSNWLTLECADERHWTVMPMGAGLADGYCGTALFLAELGRLSGSERHLEAADRAVRALPALVRLLARNPDLAAAVGPGGFFGVGGVCYAAARLSTLLDSQDLAAAVPQALEALEAACPSAGADVAHGTAGALLAAEAVRDETG